ncbi:MAG: IS256 family transposase [Candidatus Nanopelagicales bacterium]|nr:IS256 family transposase [Candidatus Nanopelagicales bacterium]
MTATDVRVGRDLIDDSALKDLMDKIESEGLELLGPDGVLTELTSRIMNLALEAERTAHLGYEHGDRAGWGSGNSRNGTSPKTVLTDAGPIPVDVPRDRNGTFEPKLIGKHQRRLEGFNDIVIGLVARGMTVRDVRSHLQDAYRVEVSPELISKITDGVLPELRAWQSRPLDAVYPIMYLDAIVVKVRSDHVVVNRPVYISLGIDLEGRKHVLGLWMGKGDEGAKFWLGVLTELRNRGVKDVLVVCCDGLTGFPDAIEATWPQASVQTCVVHLIRNSIKYCSWKDRKKVAAALKPIYRAPTVAAAADALDDFEIEWGQQYPAIVDLWRRNWERFTPFLAFDPAIRKIIYTTNAIESLNYQLRKVTKTRGHFPTDDAALKIFYLAICNIGTQRGGELGTHTQGWKQALNALAMAHPGRI